LNRKKEENNPATPFGRAGTGNGGSNAIGMIACPFFVLHTIEEHEKRTQIETAMRLSLSSVVHGSAMIVVITYLQDKEPAY